MQPQLNPPLPDQPKPAGQGWERKAQPELAKPRRWPWLAGLFVVAAAGYFYWTWRNDKERQNLTASAGIRTFTVQGGGRLDNTILLTGQTGPEKYSSLLTPQMRGGRGQSGRGDGQNFGSRQRGGNGGSGGGGTGASSGGGGGSSSGGASGASAASAASAAVVSTSTSSSAAGGSGSSSGMSAGMRSSTSRVGGASGASRTPARSSTSAASGSMGPDGTGSSAANLPGNQGGGGAPGGGGGGMRGGGGPGGGMSEFSLVLQDAAKPGSRVKKGDVVAEFDRQYMLTRLDDFRASVAQAEASYQKLLAQVEVNKKAHDQTIANAVAAVEKAKLDMKTLAVLSSMDSERRGLALEEAEARLKQLRQEVRYVDIGLAADRRTADLEMQQARLELKRNEMNADRMIMKAPIDGLVVFQNTFRGSEFDAIKVGDQLSPGMMFMQIVEPGSMIINASVNQADIERLRIGQKATVRFDAFPGLELPAHIAAIGSVARASRSRPDWVKEMAVVLKLDKMDPRVIPDLSVSCNVVLQSADAPAVVPREAIFQDGKDSKPYAFVRAASGAWERREVETGLTANTQISVKSGLRTGDVVALDRPAAPGAKPETVSTLPGPERAAVVPPRRRVSRS